MTHGCKWLNLPMGSCTIQDESSNPIIEENFVHGFDVLWGMHSVEWLHLHHGARFGSKTHSFE